MIRAATIDDFPAIDRMRADFETATGRADLSEKVPYSSAHFHAAVSAMISGPFGFAALWEPGDVCGVFLATAGVSPFRPCRIAREVMFWIDPDARGAGGPRLLRTYLAWARQVGAAGAVGIALDARAGKLYERAGLSALETGFLKVFE